MHTGKLFSEISSWKEVLKFLMKRFLKPHSIPVCIRTIFTSIITLKSNDITSNILMKTYTGSKVIPSSTTTLKNFSSLKIFIRSPRQWIFYLFLNSIFNCEEPSGIFAAFLQEQRTTCLSVASGCENLCLSRVTFYY
mgnify:CR=1 FL=1